MKRLPEPLGARSNRRDACGTVGCSQTAFDTEHLSKVHDGKAGMLARNTSTPKRTMTRLTLT